MIVGELIRRLQKVDPNTEVVVDENEYSGLRHPGVVVLLEDGIIHLQQEGWYYDKDLEVI